MSDNTLGVDDISGSERNACIFSLFDKASVWSSDSLVDIGQQWDFHIAESTIFSSFKSVLHVWEFGVNRAGYNLATSIMELFGFVAESDDLSWAHEGEVKRVEEQD